MYLMLIYYIYILNIYIRTYPNVKYAACDLLKLNYYTTVTNIKFTFLAQPV